MKATYIPFLYIENFIALQTVIQELRTVRDDAKGARPEGKCLIAEA